MATMTTTLSPLQPTRAPNPTSTGLTRLQASQLALAELFPDVKAAADEALAELFPALRVRRPAPQHYQAGGR